MVLQVVSFYSFCYLSRFPNIWNVSPKTLYSFDQK